MNRPLLTSLGLLALLSSRLFAAVDSVVVFNELHYHPLDGAAGGEWIELHNQMAIDIDLSGWHLEDGVNFTFPEGTIIAGGGHLVIASDPAGLQAATGLAGVLGPFTGQLANSGELLQLRDRNDRLMDEMTYRDGGRWPVAADGSGATLAKRDPNTTSAPAENWTSSVVVGGTPGARNFPDSAIVVQPLVPLGGLWRFEASGTDLGSAWKDPTFDDSAWPGENGASLVSYWPFDGDATATVGTDGSSVGAVTPTADRAGTAGRALAFGGPSQYVEVPGGGGLNAAASGTISLWAKWNASFQDADCCGNFGAILARQGNGQFSDNILALSTSNPATAKLVWRQSGGPAPVLITGTTTIGTGWRHIAVTFSPEGTTLYVNGIPQGTATGSPLSDGGSVPLSIGAWAGDGAGFMNGTLDDVAVWNAPLTAEQIAELAASTKSPLDFSGSQNAVYFSGDGRLAENDSWRSTELPIGPVTHYFRTAFDFSDSPALTALALDLAVDDGAVVWLNGTEVHRHNLPAGPVTYATRALTAVGDAPLLAGITLPATALLPGRNVLAIEVHQAESPDPGMVFGAALTATITPAGFEASRPDSLVINEITPGGTPLQIELINRGAGAVDAAGFLLRRTGVSPDATITLPARALAPGDLFVLDQAALGFGAVTGDRLFLLRPGATAAADAVEITGRFRARWPNGTGPFLTPTSPSFGSANAVTLRHDIVINELMYHAPATLAKPAAGGAPAVPYSRNPEQWIELLNTASQPVDLSGWHFDEGIDFVFPDGSVIAAGGHLVVANDPASLNTAVPGLGAIGPFTGSLSRSGERLVLRDAVGNPADSVAYSDDGRWPEAADGGGSSLELRDPRADNTVGESWAASDESARSSWQTYVYEGTAAASSVGPDSQWREFVVGLLAKGEVLLDDISVVEAPAGAAVSMLQNGSFESGAEKWRIIGNHHGTVIDDPDQPGNKVLRLVATGSTDHMSNHAETTLAGGRSVVNGRVYRISFRAKWISGCRQLNTRLYFNRLPKTTVLDGRPRWGTPGAPNSTRAANLGPACDTLRHEPAVPAPLAPVTVSATATDPDGVASMTLWSRPDGGPWSSQPMTADGGSPARFTASLIGRAAGTVVQFYVEATDSLGATSRLPAAGPESRALYKVNDGLAKTNGLHNVRLVTLADDATQLHTTINLMSNERIGATLVYDEREVFYDVGLRLKGSEHSRTTSQRLGFNVGFNSAQLFRGVHRSFAIDRSESTGFGQREMLVHQMLNHCGGVPTKYHDLIQVMAPRAEHTGSAELQLGRYSDVFLDGQFENGSDGMVFEYELVYQLNATDNGTPEGNKIPAPDSVVGISLGGLGALGARSDNPESYRWTFLVKNNEDRDDFSGVIPFCKWLNTSGTTFTSQITTRLDVNQWLRGHAVNVLSGAGDSYGGDGSQHNVQFYVRPSDGRMLYFPHDMDAFFDASRPIVPNSDLQKIIAVPAHARTYYQHLLDIMQTTYNTAYMTHWANHFGQLLPGQPFASHLAFIGQRRTFVTSQVNAAVSPNTAFAITTNGGADLTTASSPVTLAGTANLAVHAIRFNGVAYPLTWTSRTAWSAAIPLPTGTTNLTIQGVDRQGNLITTAVDTIAVTNTGPGSPLPVVINEWMADNSTIADPADGQFQDWIELFNPNDLAVDLSGFTLTDDLSQPAKWSIPTGTTISPRGFLVVWADNDIAQNTPGNGLHAGFQLGASGESIGLFNAQGVPQHTLTFGPQSPNVSEGLLPDGNVSAAGTLPAPTPGATNSPTAPFSLTSITHADGSVTLVWESVAGRSYRVEFKDALESPTWTPIAPDITATDLTTTATDPVGPNPQRFYRVRRLD
jgi:hypothetical protein